uniref:Cell death suppressor protein Lls1, putative, expressed n=1 Tax=Oryza sativa subsp. japonica TaxID=39947 RepID=Q10BT2_ORYSJ|nr:cell death suppressor protein Lls1, putative, expressed [Oryza sativa Japonica Group]
MRGAEQHPVVLPEIGAGVQGDPAEEAAAIHPADRRPVLRHRLWRQGSPLWVRCVGGESHGPCSCPLRAQGVDAHPQEGRSRKIFEFDKEGGGPLKMEIEETNVEGFLSMLDRGFFKFVAPCTFYGSPLQTPSQDDQGKEKKKKQPTVMLVFLCIPVSPGRSRLVWAFPRNVGVWMDKIIPRWYYHIGQNAILDSDIYLLHIEERNFATVGLDNWQKACYVPTSSDNMIITFRNWFRKYCKHQIGWATPITNQLPPTPSKDQLLDRYWSHVMQCTSCSGALKKMKALEVALQVASVAVVGFLAVAKGTVVTSVVQRSAVVAAAVLCFAASRWLANFIEKNFYFQDYVHAYK